MILVDGYVLVQRNRGRWRKGFIPLCNEDLERLKIRNLGKTSVLLAVFRQGEVYDSKELGKAKALYEKIFSLQKELDAVRRESGLL